MAEGAGSDKEDGSSGNESVDSDASSDFGLGNSDQKVKKAKAKAKSPKVARTKTAAPAGKDGKGDPPSEKAAEKASKAAEKAEKAMEKANEKSKSLMEQGSKLSQSLTAVTPTALWKGALKEADTAAKLKKVATSAGQLSQHAATCEDETLKKSMEELAASMNQKVSQIDTMQECFKRLRGCGKGLLPILQEEEFAQKFSSICSSVDAECLSAVLLFLGQKLSEAGSVGMLQVMFCQCFPHVYLIL